MSGSDWLRIGSNDEFCDAVMNIRGGNFLTRWATLNFSRNTLYHELRSWMASVDICQWRFGVLLSCWLNNIFKCFTLVSSIQDLNLTETFRMAENCYLIFWWREINVCFEKMAVFWVVAPCSLVEVYQRFRGPCCLHHQGDGRGLSVSYDGVPTFRQTLQLQSVKAVF
jgi:hypothetical protein